MSEIIRNIDPDESLMSLIVEKLKSGDAKLPTEAQMSEDLGISRSLLREKMRYLEANGLIRFREAGGLRSCRARAIRSIPSGRSCSR